MKKANINSILPGLFLFILLIAAHSNCFSQSNPLPNGFAHNDYCHKHPLYDALDNGFTNIEADIFLKDNRLIVAHIFPYFKHSRTLEKLYLEPLMERVNKNNGKIYNNYNAPIILMIDIKTDANKTYAALMPLLEKYKSILSGIENGQMVRRAVTVVISGHKPYRLIENEQSRYAFIDEDLRKVQRDTTNSNSNVFTMASCKYSNLVKWDGKGRISNAEQNKLLNFVAMAHKLGSKVRLWASPEKKVVWDELLHCGVDLINTDHLVALKNYLNTSPVILTRAN